MRRLWFFGGLLIPLIAHGEMDPTRPTNIQVAPGPGHKQSAVPAIPVEQHLDLQYLLTTPGRRLARINGQLISEGDHILGWQIVNIATDHVDLERHGKYMRLRMFAPPETLPLTLSQP